MTKLEFEIKKDFNKATVVKEQLVKNREKLFKMMVEMEKEAKIKAPVDTGRLRASIHLDPSKPADKISLLDGVPYGCVFNAQTKINCGKNKSKTIGQVKVGDKVLAQDGLLHKVVKTFKYPAINKSNLVELEVEYRKDKTHKLVLTDDHKVLVKINNCNKWIKAGNLKKGNVVFSPVKKNYNIKTAKKISCVCKYCGKKFKVLESQKLKYNRGVFCSQKCQGKFYKGKNNPNFGNKYSAKVKEHLSKVRKKFYKKFPEKHVNRILAKKNVMTIIEKQVRDWLVNAEIDFNIQKKVGSKFVDFYIPSLKMIIECDGGYWHKNQEKDIERDKYLKNKLKDFIIVHLRFCDYRDNSNFDRNPLNNVYYLRCNPSFNSFVNIDSFKEVKVINVKKFKYDDKRKNGSSKNAFLYDLSVEGMHSFVASGVLISNSFQEFGTSRMKAQPFMVPALNKVRNKVIREKWFEE